MAYVISDTCMFIEAGLTRAECASWVQAVCSILALVAVGAVAVGQIWAQRSDAARARAHRRQAAIEAVFTLAKLLLMEVAARAALLDERATSEGRRKIQMGEPFLDVRDAARSIPLHDLPDADTVRLVFDLRRLSGLTVEVHEAVVGGLDTVEGAFFNALQPYAMVEEGLRELQRKCIASMDGAA